MTWFLLLYFLVFSFVYVSPSVPCASQVIQPRPSIQPLVRAKHSATRPGQASDRLSRPSIPLARGIRLLVAAQHSTVCHGKASRSGEAFSRSSQPSIQPFVTAKHPACYLVNLCASSFHACPVIHLDLYLRSSCLCPLYHVGLLPEIPMLRCRAGQPLCDTPSAVLISV